VDADNMLSLAYQLPSRALDYLQDSHTQTLQFLVGQINRVGPQICQLFPLPFIISEERSHTVDCPVELLIPPPLFLHFCQLFG
jgi:hypothetical protein